MRPFPGCCCQWNTNAESVIDDEGLEQLKRKMNVYKCASAKISAASTIALQVLWPMNLFPLETPM